MTPEQKIKFLTEAELPHWREKLKEAKNEDKSSVRTKQITGVVEIMELKADMLRIRNNQKPETGLVKKLIITEAKIGDISRLKRFTNWAKENLLGLFSAAGIITTVVIAGHGAVRSGARATKRFAKGLAKVAEKVAPVLGAVLNLVGKTTRKNTTDSEEFYNVEVEKVKVTIEGNPNSVYSQGLVRSQVYDKARRFFGSTTDASKDNFSKLEFLKNKYALVVDLRTVNDENVVHSGGKLVGMQSGILLEIEKLAMTVDLLCHL